MSDVTNDERVARFFSIVLPSPSRAIAAYEEALSLPVPGCCYAFPLEGGAVLTSVTFSQEDHAVASNSPPFVTDEIGIAALADSILDDLVQLADIGLSRNFLTSPPFHMVSFDGISTTIDGNVGARKIGRNEPCPCNRLPRRKHKHCCGA